MNILDMLGIDKNVLESMAKFAPEFGSKIANVERIAIESLRQQEMQTDLLRSIAMKLGAVPFNAPYIDTDIFKKVDHD